VLTTEQRAKRRTSKINNRVNRELPLFVGTGAISQFQTTHEAQLARVQQWDEFNDRYFAKIDEHDNETFLRAIQYRDQLSKIVDISSFDEILRGKQSRWALFYRPEYIADYWFTELRKAKKEKEKI
jgi:hypothetical protein